MGGGLPGNSGCRRLLLFSHPKPSLQTSTFSHHTSKSTPLANPISKVSPPARPTHPPTYTSTPPPVPSSKAHSSTNLRRHWLHPPPPHSSPPNTNTNHFTEQSKYPIIQPHFHLNLSRKKKKKKNFFHPFPLSSRLSAATGEIHPSFQFQLQRATKNFSPFRAHLPNGHLTRSDHKGRLIQPTGKLPVPEKGPAF